MAKGKNVCIEINLLPAEFRQSKADFSWIVDRRVIWPTVALVVFIVAAFMLQTYVWETQNSLENELTETQAAVEKEKPLLNKIADLDAKLNVIAQKTAALKSIQVSKKRWVILFENISSMLPPNMWLTNLNQVSPLEMELQGMTYDFSEVAEYMVKLEKQVSIGSVTLVSISTTKSQNGDADVYNFTIRATIKADLGLEGGAK